MASVAEKDIESTAREARTMIRYVDPGDFVTRRYVSRGREMNTGTYSDHEVTIRDGMPIRDHFELDVHGFMIGKNPTKVADFHDKDEVDSIYEREVEADIMRRTGASKAVARGWMIRTSADLTQRAEEKVANYEHTGGVQPTAGEAHIDLNPATARRMAEYTYKKNFPDGPGYKRFLIASYWRTFSPGPQDVPLGLCDGRSAVGSEEKSNTLFVVDEFPSEEDAVKPVEGEENMIAATIPSYSPDHRWWYFSDMEKDDILLFKFFDSDQGTTWRCPHSAFIDNSIPDANVRESIEVRCVAFWE